MRAGEERCPICSGAVVLTERKGKAAALREGLVGAPIADDDLLFVMDAI
jgi:hypothetical protein